MEESILTSTKKILGIDAAYTAFDLDVITHINTVFSVLDQLGVGPIGGAMITDDTPTWVDVFGDDKRLNMIKSYVYLRVRILFDPPTSGFALDSLKEQYKEMEWRLNVHREGSQVWGTSPTSLQP